MKCTKLYTLPDGVKLIEDFGIASTQSKDVDTALKVIYDIARKSFPEANLIMAVSTNPILDGRGVHVSGQLVKVQGPGYD